MPGVCVMCDVVRVTAAASDSATMRQCDNLPESTNATTISLSNKVKKAPETIERRQIDKMVRVYASHVRLAGRQHKPYKGSVFNQSTCQSQRYLCFLTSSCSCRRTSSKCRSLEAMRCTICACRASALTWRL